MTDDRLYIKVHNGMPDHPKIEPLSDAAFRLIVSLWCWCDRHDLDGKVPLSVWERRGTKKSRQELFDNRLAHLNEDHVQLHDYLEHQRSAEQKQAAKDRARTAGQAGGLAKAKRTASKSLSDSSSKNVAEVEVEKEVESQNQAPRANVTRIRTTATLIGSTLLAEHYEGLPAPSRVKQRMGEVIDEMVAEGFDPDVIREALQRLRKRPNGGPALLPSIVGDVMQERSPRRRTESERMFG